MESHYGEIAQQNPGNIFLLESPVGRLVRTHVHVLSDCVVCGNNDAIANESWVTQLSEAWDPMTFIDKYDITGRPVQFH